MTSTLAVINAAVFDGESAELPDGPVLVEDGTIVSVGADADADSPEAIEHSVRNGVRS